MSSRIHEFNSLGRILSSNLPTQSVFWVLPSAGVVDTGKAIIITTDLEHFTVICNTYWITLMI